MSDKKPYIPLRVIYDELIGIIKFENKFTKQGIDQFFYERGIRRPSYKIGDGLNKDAEFHIDEYMKITDPHTESVIRNVVKINLEDLVGVLIQKTRNDKSEFITELSERLSEPLGIPSSDVKGMLIGRNTYDIRIQMYLAAWCGYLNERDRPILEKFGMYEVPGFKITKKEPITNKSRRMTRQQIKDAESHLENIRKEVQRKDKTTQSQRLSIQERARRLRAGEELD